METTATKQAREKSVNPVALSTPERRMPQGPAPAVTLAPEKKPVGYGLPCSRCHAYYPADMHVLSDLQVAGPCLTDRTGDAFDGFRPCRSPTTSAPQIDDERERFLKEIKSQAFASHTQINAAATFRAFSSISTTEPLNQPPSAIPATARPASRPTGWKLLSTWTLKKRAKIVYEAVWADTSDPNTTYLNAATALLSELRKRAGIGLLLGYASALGALAVR